VADRRELIFGSFFDKDDIVPLVPRGLPKFGLRMPEC
jgi:hypothetical protein